MEENNTIKVDTGQEEAAAEDLSTKEKEADTKAADAKENQTETAGAAAPEEDHDAAGEASREDDSDSEEDSKDKDRKSFFAHRKDKEKEAMQDKINALQDRVTRQMAEFDNYRKRTEKEKEQMFSNGESSVLEKMLPIVDNFERGFDTVTEEDKDDAFVQGMHKVYDQLVKQLKDLGVEPMDAEGKDFDPEYHNAVMQVDSDKYESGKVAQELQKGYMYHGRVLRHSMVSVVK